jgi:hypothetical protein
MSGESLSFSLTFSPQPFAVIGFIVLAALLSQAYLGYEDRSFALENYESASLLQIPLQQPLP